MSTQSVSRALRRFLDDIQRRSPNRHRVTDCDPLLNDALVHMETMDGISSDRNELATLLATDPSLHQHAIFRATPNPHLEPAKSTAKAHYSHADLLTDTDRYTADIEAGPSGAARAEFVKEREADRVLDCIERSIAQQVIDGSFLLTSSAETHEFWVCVPVQYASAADRAVVFEVKEVYTRKMADAHRQRPYFTKVMRYNVERPLAREPKLVFCAHFYFRFPNDPRIDAQ